MKRKKLSRRRRGKSKRVTDNWQVGKIILFFILCMIFGATQTYFTGPESQTVASSKISIMNLDGSTFFTADKISNVHNEESLSEGSISINWCDRVAKARTDLDPSLAITYPCEGMKPAVSAVVCMLTGSVAANRANKILFTAREYIDGAMALGVTLMENLDHSQTHQLLLLRKGFELAPDDIIRLTSVGWTIGTAPEFKILQQYTPLYERYKTTYTKVTAIGLEEYKCVLLMDADTLVVGDISSLMTCNKFTKPQHRVAGTLDLENGQWWGMNTGSILWRTSAKEMNRVFQLAQDAKFMKRFSSDQHFLNNVYPERFNKEKNKKMIYSKLTAAAAEEEDVDNNGAVVDLTWFYNAQTHVEAERISFWEERLPQVKILHFTRRKGWQCEERYGPPPPLDQMPKTCHHERGGLLGGQQAPICYCRESDKYWNALKRAKLLAEPKLTPSQ